MVCISCSRFGYVRAILIENYDYKLKYDEDEYNKELSEEARVFWVYMDEAKLFDDDLVAELGDGLDLSIIFVRPSKLHKVFC